MKFIFDKRSIILGTMLIALLFFQNLGDRYGSYYLWAWIWSVVVISPIIALHFQKERDYPICERLVSLNIFLSILSVLIQPFFKVHPIYILGFVSTINTIVLFIIINRTLFNKKRKELYVESLNGQIINKETREKCILLIARNEIDLTFQILMDEVQSESKDHLFLVHLYQKWNKIQKDQALNLQSPELLDKRSSLIVESLINIINNNSNTFGDLKFKSLPRSSD